MGSSSGSTRARSQASRHTKHRQSTGERGGKGMHRKRPSEFPALEQQCRTRKPASRTRDAEPREHGTRPPAKPRRTQAEMQRRRAADGHGHPTIREQRGEKGTVHNGPKSAFSARLSISEKTHSPPPIRALAVHGPTGAEMD